MARKNIIALCLITSSLLFSIRPAIAQEPYSATQPSAEKSKASSDYVIGEGDLLDIRIINQDKLGGKYRVSDSGTISMPFVGQVKIAGLTEMAATDSIRERLLKFIRQPELSVSVAEYNSKFVTVMGTVKIPGRYALHQTMRLLDVVGIAGGATERTGTVINLVRYPQTNRTPQAAPNSEPQDPDKDGIKVYSINILDLLAGSPELNMIVTPGDLINLPEADTIYVTGNINKPGAYSTKSPVTLTQAIALAGGLTIEAQRKQIRLFRTKRGEAEREELSFDLSAIEKQKIKDPILLPNDVLYIRGSESRSLGISFVRALTGGLGSSVGFSVLR